MTPRSSPASSPDPAAPLAGTRVLDFSRVLAGPFATMMMADMGAEVVKIEERTQGDDTRGWGPPFLESRERFGPAHAGAGGAGRESVYFLSVNRNKKSVTLNLKSDEGREIARRLAGLSDVLVENFRPGTMDRLGLGFEELHRLNPRLVYCSISGFGQTGPERDRAGYDVAIQGEAGLMSITGFPDGPPTKAGVSLADLVAGQYAMQGVLLALRVVQNGGEGQHLDIALLDSLLSLLTFQAGSYFATGSSPRRRGNLHPMITPYETYSTSDGYVIIACGNEGLWKRFCDVLGRPDLADDPRFLTNFDRVANRDALAALITPLVAARPTADWLDRLDRAGIPRGAVRTVDEALESEQVRAREMVQAVEHATLGPLRTLGIPVKLSATPGAVRSAPPVLGQHTDEVLSGLLGYSPGQIAAMRAAGVV